MVINRGIGSASILKSKTLDGLIDIGLLVHEHSPVSGTLDLKSLCLLETVRLRYLKLRLHLVDKGIQHALVRIGYHQVIDVHTHKRIRSILVLLDVETLLDL